MRWRDRAIGAAIGVILGIGVIAGFVFVFSERTLDAPSLSGDRGGAQAPGVHRGREGDGRAPVATVRVIGGAPPAGGPAELRYRRGELVRLRLISDANIGVRLLGYGINRRASADRPTMIRFEASRPGSFPLLVTRSHIGIARITVGGPAGP